jgi:hypothetical protein
MKRYGLIVVFGLFVSLTSAQLSVSDNQRYLVAVDGKPGNYFTG